MASARRDEGPEGLIVNLSTEVLYRTPMGISLMPAVTLGHPELFHYAPVPARGASGAVRPLTAHQGRSDRCRRFHVHRLPRADYSVGSSSRALLP